ncbi:ABC-type multidrug transport system, ATPase component [Reichenbachiella faecimaris]|uniref:ABC-type multidrug transport system, ATPase component n=1 Tax=Reichenbachiella faecimaris TaxID=692418 RepID=A0A1W2G948_REIFA|nr:ATP-binding cassette domain-containing protein [Reichenbachiella faecimaris]SMD33024.1 ABC-type multidrug transport system, ATPase component [Reichenbachiella faecimaris]
MSESIINALMRLFAIIESVKDEVVDSGHIIVQPYLQAQLNHELAEQYLNLYQDYVEFYRREASSSEEELENETKNIIQVTKICQQLNKELLQHERVIVFIQLVELINTDNKVSEKENDFMQLVALNFNLPKQEIGDITSFILDPQIKELSKPNGMIIDNKVTEWPEEIAWMMKKKKEPGITEFRHIHVENLFGQIKVLFIQSIGTFVVQYDGPLNLYLEGNKISKNKTYILKSGSIIKGSTIEPIYESEISKRFLLDLKKVNLVLHGDEMQFRFKNSTNGIQPFSFYEESGQLIGIMGGSGTGKSTLINLLNGKLEPSDGKIKINGHSIPRCVQSGVIGYVPQDDLLFEELTVYQNLYFNARLSFSDFSKKRLDQAINKVLEDLDIDEIRDLEVGSPLNKFISGGQRKRLNIALELLREPSVLFVDEPTSGLSSMDSEVVMNLLKEQSRKGKLVIAIIHQPSSDIYKLFDKLWLLDKGGYPIYNGNPVDAVVYFKTMNTQVNAAESECRVCGNVIPEQILHIIESKEINESGEATKRRKIAPAEWYDKYKENIAPKIKKIKFQTALPPSNFLIPNLAQQSNIFFQRILLSKKTNLQYILLNLFEPPLLALILGILSKYSEASQYIFSENKNIPVYLFMTVVVSLFLGLSVSAEEIFKDKKVLERESFLNLSRFSYINSKIIYLFGLSALQMFIFVWFGNYLLEIKSLSLSFWLVLFSTACFANMVGLNISSGLNSIVTIYILIPLILVPQLLLGGAMIKFDELHYKIGDKKHVPLVGDAMVSRWAYEALAVELFRNNDYEKHFFGYDKRMSDASFNFAYLIPKIQTKLKLVYQNIEAGNQSSALQHEIDLCRKELEKLQVKDGNTQFYRLRFLTMNKYDSTSHHQILAQLNLLRKKYKNLKDEAVKEREAHYYELVESIGKDGLLDLKNNSHNKTLENLVTNRDEIEKIYEAEDELIQKKDPIFKTPDSNIGNAHFYAPVKVFGNVQISTFYCNIIIIWLMTAFFYITLYYDTLRKCLSFITNKFTKY